MLTEPLERILGPIADKAGISRSEYATWTGGEIIGTLLEAIADATTVGWLNKTVNLGAGLLALGYALLGRGVDPRFKRELVAIGNHLLGRVLDPKPSDLEELAASVRQLIACLQAGDIPGAIESGLRRPEELVAAVQSLLAATPTRESGETAWVPTPVTWTPTSEEVVSNQEESHEVVTG